MSAKTLAQVQAQNGLWDELWQVAVDEAYNANDAVRRMAEIAGRCKRDVVEAYFNYHPEMRDWAAEQVATGTCESAIHELRAMLKRTRELRAEQRAARAQVRVYCEPPPDDAPDWMKPFMLGPARVEFAAPEAAEGKPSQDAVNAWMCDYFAVPHREGRPPPKVEMDAFPDCVRATGATNVQMRKAMRVVPAEHKRSRGGKDR